ncbi:SDR family oxidoreductase [Pseudonocardia eucalypti]|uniref:SDR family oxidoreductase n=1 Tax=Pseudonocardia eucalypti TaxID=648755 RepID=A0ABP9Q982_9PSEU|nr:NAD(P)-dependent dehydrogenase (short-subunit alcohol dehydrogenase family) [Pseudonocardia eucalypti]
MLLTGKRVLITGAASGIGRATALRAAHEGAELYLTDLSESGLAETVRLVRDGGGAVGCHRVADVSDLEQVRQLAEAVHARVTSVDVVMNIAGVSTWGTVDRLSHEQWRKMIEVNLMGPIHVIEEFVPPMIRAGRGGYLVQVASAAGLLGLPWHAAYSASKFGLRGISEVLRFDLAEHRIGVSLVCPGGVRTGLTDTVEIAGVDRGDPELTRLRERFLRHAVTPERAADAIITGMRRNRYLVYTSADIRLMYLVQRVCPPLYVVAMRLLNRAMRRALPVTP